MPNPIRPLTIAHVGGMYTGKTRSLIRAIERSLNIRCEAVLLVTPAIDTRPKRAPDAIVEDHDGYPLRTHPLLTHLSLPTHGPSPKLPDGVREVFIDEAQFFGPWVVAWIEALALQSVHVQIYALDTDYRGKSWPTTREILSIVDAVEKHHGTCASCGKGSNRTQRLAESRETVLVGGSDLYEPRCRWCHTRNPNASTDRAILSYPTDADGGPLDGLEGVA